MNSLKETIWSVRLDHLRPNSQKLKHWYRTKMVHLLVLKKKPSITKGKKKNPQISNQLSASQPSLEKPRSEVHKLSRLAPISNMILVLSTKQLADRMTERKVNRIRRTITHLLRLKSERIREKSTKTTGSVHLRT